MIESDLSTCPWCGSRYHSTLAEDLHPVDVCWRCGSYEQHSKLYQTIACERNVLAKEVERLRTQIDKHRETVRQVICLARAGKVAEQTYQGPSRKLADLWGNAALDGLDFPNPALTMNWAVSEIERLGNLLETERAERKAVIDDVLVAEVERLKLHAQSEYDRGLEEGNCSQAILEVQGRKRFLEKFKKDGCPRCPHKGVAEAKPKD